MADPVVGPEMYARVFEGHHEGALVLEDLIKRFARPAKLEGGIDAIITTFHRDGSRKVVEFITIMINTARGVPNANDDE